VGDEEREAQMNRRDYSARDEQAKLVFYVLLWKRQGISLELFDNYWRDVHGPVCARLPGQYQYWQLHVAHSSGSVWPAIPGIDFTCTEQNQFDGIAELSFRSDADRMTWFTSAAILMDDEQNLFRKAIGYNTSFGNSITYVDAIEVGDPNGALGLPKFHVMVKKAAGASLSSLRDYLRGAFASTVSASPSVLKFRLHLFEEVDASRPDAPGVAHNEPPEQNYHAAFEIAFASREEMDRFFTSSQYATAVKSLSQYVGQMRVFPERSAYAFVYAGGITLAGQRSSSVAELITTIGATNQLRDDVTGLMFRGPSTHSMPGAVPRTASGAANAVLDDSSLQAALRTIHPRWGDFCIRVAGEAWGLPLIDQRTKALITIATDVVNGNQSGPGSPFEAHVDMALKQGVTRPELEELMLFMSVYAGFNKAASGIGRLKEIETKGHTALGALI
jgi:alkylhydroperoxidase/carboxymuconolactone decarboxylase family protein YurZ